MVDKDPKTVFVHFCFELYKKRGKLSLKEIDFINACLFVLFDLRASNKYQRERERW